MPRYNFSKLFLTITLLALGATGFSCQTKDLTAPIVRAEQEKPSQTDKDTVTIAAVGDIMLGSTSINDSFLPPNDGRDMLKEVTPILSAADIAFGNLEGPMLEGGISEKCLPPKPDTSETKAPTPTPTPAKPGSAKAKPAPIRCFAFRVPTRYGKYLKDAGFDVLSLANNHAADFGDYGRSSTRKVLDNLGIKYAGSDRDRYSTAYLDVNGKKVAFIGFAHNNIVPNVNDLASAKKLVNDARKKADIVVVSFHGGAEGEAAQMVPRETEVFAGEKRGNLRLFAHTVIDAGADLIIGHGPHVMRGMEIYKGHLIAYSMGNFATYGMFNLKGPQGLAAIFEITLASDGKFAGGKIIAAKQVGRGGPVLDPSGEAIRKLRELSQADFGASAPKIADDGTISQ
jgi:hypothetical protein